MGRARHCLRRHVSTAESPRPHPARFGRFNNYLLRLTSCGCLLHATSVRTLLKYYAARFGRLIKVVVLSGPAPRPVRLADDRRLHKLQDRGRGAGQIVRETHHRMPCYSMNRGLYA
jgi:hypothetical protein